VQIITPFQKTCINRRHTGNSPPLIFCTVRIPIELHIRGPYKELYGHFDSRKTGITELHVGKGALSEVCTPSWKLRVLRNWNCVCTDMETASTPKLKLCVHWNENCVYSEIETMCTLTRKLRVLRNWNYVYTNIISYN